MGIGKCLIDNKEIIFVFLTKKLNPYILKNAPSTVSVLKNVTDTTIHRLPIHSKLNKNRTVYYVFQMALTVRVLPISPPCKPVTKSSVRWWGL